MWWMAEIITGIVLLFHAAGMVHAVHALMRTRTSQGTIAWIMALLFLPYAAVPLYWFLGRDRFTGYVRARRSNDQTLSQKAADFHAGLKPFEQAHDSPFMKSAEALSGLPLLGGNRLDLFTDGKKTFDALFHSIESATTYVLVNYYIMKHDAIGDALQKILVAKARSGVQVWLLFDELGSNKLPRRFLREMKDAGVHFHSFGINRFWWSRLQYNFRNHRKIVVCDGREAYIGGLNVADEYLGWHPDLGYWRDTHMRITGPAVLAVQLVFFEDWYWASGSVPKCPPQQVPQPENQSILILPTGPADVLDSWQLFIVEACNHARKRLWIASPYFVPDTGVTSALQAAALRGVDVRILIPERADSRLVNWAAYSYYEQILPSGVKIYRYQKGFLHQKVVLSDRFVSVGTGNLDNRSFRLNFEITGFTGDAKFVDEVEKMLENDFLQSSLSEIDDYLNKPWYFKAACRAARLLSPIL
jgi:cardiolipin synthase